MNTTSQNFTSWLQKYSPLLLKLFAALLMVLAIYWLAKTVWLWVDYAQPKTVAADSGERPKVRTARPVNINPIVNKHLFGVANAAEQEVEDIVGETNLNLKLLGVYVGTDRGIGSAIIRTNAKKEKVYWIGDSLEISGRSNVTLERVEPLKVIINNNGKNETLTLLEQLNKQVLNSAKKSEESRDGKVLDRRRDSRISKQLADMKRKLVSSPQSFADLARFERVVDENGQASGFKLAPGKDRRLFTQLGLRRNDVVKSINGIDLDEQAYWSALEQLQSANELKIALERNGKPVTLLLNIAESAEPPSNNQTRQTRNTVATEIK